MDSILWSILPSTANNDQQYSPRISGKEYWPSSDSTCYLKKTFKVFKQKTIKEFLTYVKNKRKLLWLQSYACFPHSHTVSPNEHSQTLFQFKKLLEDPFGLCIHTSNQLPRSDCPSNICITFFLAVWPYRSLSPSSFSLNK